MAKVTPTSRRKADHLRINLDHDVRSALTTGLARWRLEHLAVPELDLRQIDTRTRFLGKELAAPILISSMTGGTDHGGRINRALAEAAQARGVALGLGSLRAALEDPARAASFQVRAVAPDILLFANLGAVQLNYGLGLDDCRRAVELVQADALVLHWNPLQEALQPEGDVDFSGLLPKVEALCRQLGRPVIAKEVGWGISPRAARLLVEAGVAVIDVAGAGGTSWSQVEMHRTSAPERADMAAGFVDWGIPTADLVWEVHQALPNAPLIASGGLRSGIDLAKCIALGAALGGFAGALLKDADHSAAAVAARIDRIVSELRICQFVTGSKDLEALQTARIVRALP